MARRIGMYFAWDRTAEAGAPLGDLNNRLPALFELRRQFWPRYEALAEAPGGQDIDGFLRAVFMQNFALSGEQAVKATGESVDHIERRTSAAETLLTDAVLDTYDTLIIISFDSQRPQAITPAETEALRGFLARPRTMLFVCPHHDIGDTDDLPKDAALERQTAASRRGSTLRTRPLQLSRYNATQAPRRRQPTSNPWPTGCVIARDIRLI